MAPSLLGWAADRDQLSREPWYYDVSGKICSLYPHDYELTRCLAAGE